ncbi:hypothetical protein GTY67_26200 [Streptomyces sp. SID8374]|uniref:hypothetical protein n=1 Tax=Streptomyces sp. SID8374 TaxID=2690354 RepID=UPI00136D2EDC|nr:hypothetical protein [Streptomyces sp. SID8374]MYX16843.1 hypothetical protein [Streptomyces sp. SID8374]
MRAAARWLRMQLGRRGQILLILGIGKVCWGTGFIVSPQQDPAGLRLLTDRCSLASWAWLWIGAGVVCIASAFVRIGRDWLGFLAALAPPSVWAVAYLFAVLTGDYARGGFVAAWYLTSHVGVIMWAATVPEHSVPSPPWRARKGKAP